MPFFCYASLKYYTKTNLCLNCFLDKEKTKKNAPSKRRRLGSNQEISAFIELNEDGVEIDNGLITNSSPEKRQNKLNTTSKRRRLEIKSEINEDTISDDDRAQINNIEVTNSFPETSEKV